MNNNATNATSINSSTVALELIQALYLNYVGILISISALALFIYTTVLAMPQEMAYIWLSPKWFSIPNLFYILARYGSLIGQALVVWLSFVPPGRLCNDLANLQSAAFISAYTGLQGLLITRAYSLCQGNKVIAGALVFFYVGGLALNIYISVTPGGCVQSFTDIQVGLAQKVCVIVTDLLVFCTCIWKVWGTWKLKRETGIRGNNDLVSVLLRQTVSRFCFVVVFTITGTVVGQFVDSTVESVTSSLQHSFSTILIVNFTLDLRQQNFAAIRATNISLPTIQIQSIVNYIHQSILEGMGDHEIPIHTSQMGDEDDVSGPLDVQIQCEEPA